MQKNKQGKPLVSVIVTAFNAERFVEKAVVSIMEQTYKNLEILIVDDGSTDKTWSMLQDLAKQDKRIKLWRLSKNSGPSSASNTALKQVQGEFIARIDADDIAFPDRIEKQLNFLRKHLEVVAVGGQCRLINEKGKLIGTKHYPITNEGIHEALFMFNPMQHPTIMINRKLLPNKLIFYKNGSVLAHDLELIFQLAQYGRLANLKSYVLYYRQHQDSLSLRNPKETFKATLRVRQRAVAKYGYKPIFKNRIIDLIQRIGVKLIPEQYVYPLFSIVRGLRKINKSTPIKFRKETDWFLFRLRPVFRYFL